MVSYYKNAVKVPKEGGEYTEGMIGQPQYINPALASANEIDADLVELIFSGLFKYSENGELVNDLIDNWEISEDKTTYSLTLKNNVFWHDGEKLSASDVLFTFKIISDPSYRSPLQQNFNSVECRIDGELKVFFTLKEPYPLFPHNLTFKILPEHIWKNIPSSSFNLASGNLKPVGSGPFKLKKVFKDEDGFIHFITLKKNDDYFGDRPLIDLVTFKFFRDQESLFASYNKKEILGINNLPQDYSENIQNEENADIFKIKSPQYFAVFLNSQKNYLLSDKNIRKALSLGTDRQFFVDEVFNGNAEKIGIFDCFATDTASSTTIYSPEESISILESSGWKDIDNDGFVEKITEGQPEVNLELSLTTLDQPWLVESAQIIKSQWEKIGVKVNLDIKNLFDLQNSTIKNRDYEMLLFGQSLGESYDPYAFWHSSQKTYPGLNLTGLSNQESDTVAEQIRTSFESSARNDYCKQLQNIISEETPAIFLFNPYKLYLVNKKIKNVEVGNILSLQNRFLKINNWYIKTKYERRNKITSPSD